MTTQELMAALEGRIIGDRLHNGGYIHVPQEEAEQILSLLKEQQETIELQGSLLTLAHAAMSHGKKEGLTNGARPGRNREDPASHS